jgi:hypothetical protein
MCFDFDIAFTYFFALCNFSDLETGVASYLGRCSPSPGGAAL